MPINYMLVTLNTKVYFHLKVKWEPIWFHKIVLTLSLSIFLTSFWLGLQISTFLWSHWSLLFDKFWSHFWKCGVKEFNKTLFWMRSKKTECFTVLLQFYWQVHQLSFCLFPVHATNLILENVRFDKFIAISARVRFFQFLSQDWIFVTATSHKFSTVVCRGENVLAPSASFCLEFWKTNCRLASVAVAGLLG